MGGILNPLKKHEVDVLSWTDGWILGIDVPEGEEQRLPYRLRDWSISSPPRIIKQVVHQLLRIARYFGAVPFMQGFLEAFKNLDRYRQVCQLFSDQALIIGVSLMIASLAASNSISSYHFEVATQLAHCCWIAFVASEEIVAGIPKSLWSRLWRCFWATALYASIFAKRLLWHNKAYLRIYARPIVCTWKAVATSDNYGAVDIALLVLFMWFDATAWVRSMVILWPECAPLRAFVWGFDWLLSLPTMAYLELSPTDDNDMTPREAIKDRECGWTIKTLARWGLYTLLVIFITLKELWWSITAFSVEMLVYLAILTGSFFPFRNVAAGLMEEDENDWGFGQLMAVMLLVLPFTGLAETLYCKPIVSCAQMVLTHLPSSLYSV